MTEREWSDDDEARIEEPPCEWGCKPGCAHIGVCRNCGATNLEVAATRCGLCRSPLRLRSV